MLKLIFLGLFLQSCIIINVKAWHVPPANFIKEFAIEHQVTSITFYLPTENASSWITWYKRNFSKWIMKMAFKYPKMEGESYYNTSLSDDLPLIVFIPNDSNFEMSINDLVNLRSQHQKIHNHEIWLLDISTWSTQYHAVKSIENAHLDFDDDFYMFKMKSQYDNVVFIELWEHYEIHHTIPRKLLHYGNWTTQNDGLKLVTEEKWTRRKDLNGINFKILSLPIASLIIMAPIRDDLFEFTGMLTDIWHNLQNVLNFTYELRMSPDKKFGNIKKDGSYNGMIGELVKHNADMAIAGFAVSPERSHVIDFGHTILKTSYNIVIKNPIGNPNYTAYILPFTHISWISVGLFCLVAPIFLFLSTICGDKEKNMQEFTWIKSSILVLSSLTQRGWSVAPTTLATRIVFFIIMLTSVLLYFLWEAMLVSYLAVDVQVLPFTGMETFMSSSNYKMASAPGWYAYSVFEHATDPTWKAVFTERMEPYVDDYAKYLDPEGRGLNVGMLLSQEDYVAIYEPTIQTQHRSQYRSCEIKSVAEYDKKNVVWAFQKDSEYLYLFNHYLRAMEEKGITKQIMEKYDYALPTCPDRSGQPLNFNSCFTGFIPLVAGGILGILMLVIEIITNKSFDVDISKYYENVAADGNAVHTCHKCGIELNSNSQE